MLAAPPVKKLLLFVVVALIATWVVWRSTRTPSRIPPSPTAPSAADAAAASSATTLPTHILPDAGGSEQVRKLSHEDRERLEKQIRAAIAKSSSAAGTAPSLDAELPLIRLEDVGKPLHQALEDAIPLLSACYGERKAGRDAMRAIAVMTMISDPELGTVIDTDEIKADNGAKMDPKVDACLRDTIDSLALPPLGKAGKVGVQYSFKFDSEPR